MENSKIILLNINGEDKPGLTAALTEILAKHGASGGEYVQAQAPAHLF